MKNTFKDRILSETHKFVQGKLSICIDWYIFSLMIDIPSLMSQNILKIS